jgi:hypothetical protein
MINVCGHLPTKMRCMMGEPSKAARISWAVAEARSTLDVIMSKVSTCFCRPPAAMLLLTRVPCCLCSPTVCFS